MKIHHKITSWAGLILLLFVLGCDSLQKDAPDTRAADEVTIRQADSSWSVAAETKQMEQFYGAFLKDAAVMSPNEPIVIGLESIRKKFDNASAMPGFSLKWQAGTVVAAGSGDIGYSLGTYEMTMNDSMGALMVDHGKYITVWRKQADGSWKVEVDMYNSDLPAPQPASN